MMYISLQFSIENYSWYNSFTDEKIPAFEIYKFNLLNLIFEAIDSYFRGLTIEHLLSNR